MIIITNHIDTIKGEQDSKIKVQEALKNEAYNHFKNLLTAEPVNLDYESFTKHILKRKNEETNSDLLKQVEENEVQAVVWGLQCDKAPGPYGFSIALFHSFWPIIKKYLIRMIRNVFRKKNMGGYKKSTFLSLIPK